MEAPAGAVPGAGIAGTRGVAGVDCWPLFFHHSDEVDCAGAFLRAAASTLPVEPLLRRANENAQTKNRAPKT